MSLAAIERVFRRPIAVFPGPAHSVQEERFKAIGRTEEGRSVFVLFTLRLRNGETLSRPISARYMRRKERDHYEKEIAGI